MTRTFVLGRPADGSGRSTSWCTPPQAAGRAACVVGATGGEIDAAARDRHRRRRATGRSSPTVSGHGVGLQIHEAPSLARGSASIMVPDMCVTVEPGVYLPGRGGVRIEDSGVMRPSTPVRTPGYDVLTLTSKDLVVL